MKKNRPIVTIQTILRGVGNEEFNNSKHIKLVRHADNRKIKIINGEEVSDSIYNLYRYDKERFKWYQAEQMKKTFDKTEYMVVFVGEHSTTARLIAVYKINGSRQHPVTPDGCILDLEEVEDFKHMSERVVIDWGKAVVSWHQDFTKQLKPVIRIDEGFDDENGVPRFISFPDTILNYHELKAIFEHNDEIWKRVLSSVNGIYLIQDKKTGKQYVGSTYSSEGIWGRWQTYFQTGGHGNNKELEEIITNDPSYATHFQWCILEQLPINILPHEAIERENLYKSKFMTREFGYNKN